jgi:DNA (cytosine-5)-methyltransferase 1
MRIWEHEDAETAAERVEALVKSRRRDPARDGVRAIDLFCGAGGATQGLRDAGHDVIAAVENDAAAAESYEANHPGTMLFRRDIRTIDSVKFRKAIGLRRGELELLKACPPCQTFSSLGKQDPTDPRNSLVAEVARFVHELRPRVVVVENVIGLGRDLHLADLESTLRRWGYETRRYEVDAVEYSVPQRRRRLIVVAVIGRPLPASFDDLLPALPRQRLTVDDALAIAEGAPAGDPLDRGRVHRPEVRRRLETLPVGGTRFDLPKRHRLPCHEKLVGRHATASYARMKGDEPAPTLTTRCTTPACGQFVHPREPRGITLREAAVLQSFPVAYIFRGNYGEIERQIGNALPVRLGEAVGLAIETLLQP